MSELKNGSIRWLREPLVQFLLLGAALFGIFALFGDQQTGGSGEIVVTPGMLENLKVSFERQWHRPPNAEELNDAIEGYVREEILSREARALGLDKDDPLIRNQLKVRMEFMLEDSAETGPPSDSELQEFVEKNPDRFKHPGGQMPTLAEVRERAQDAWIYKKREQAMDAAYRKLRQRYKVIVQRSAPAASATPLPTLR